MFHDSQEEWEINNKVNSGMNIFNVQVFLLFHSQVPAWFASAPVRLDCSVSFVKLLELLKQSKKSRLLMLWHLDIRQR